MDKRIFGILTALLLLPAFVGAVSVGQGVGISIDTEHFKPLIWMCGHRVVMDDNVEPGRITNGGEEMYERINNYAFEGEQIKWRVLVMDKNGVEKIKDVYVAVGEQGSEDYIEANCVLETNHTKGESLDSSCNARIGEEQLTVFDPTTMAYYVCTFTVEPGSSMHGEHWVHAVVEDLDGNTTTVDEDEYWFFNPELRLGVTGSIDFGEVRPGTTAYSPTILVRNEAEDGSGVLYDMFISGTDFYDPAHSGAKCPTTNQLSLQNFAYYAVNGAYSTLDDPRRVDDEGYVPINYGDHFESTFYDNNEIMQVQQVTTPYGANYYAANVLAPGAEMSITFRLSLPEPCNGDFTDGQIYFWAEAI